MNMKSVRKVVPAAVRSSFNRVSRSPRRLAAELVASGAFDANLHRTRAGLGSVSDVDVAIDYIRYALPDGVAPHALIAFPFFPRKVRDALAKPDAAHRVLRYLRHPGAKAHAWGPLFDPRPFKDDASLSGLDVLRRLEDDDSLPVSPQFQGPVPTLRFAREAALRHADLLVAQSGNELRATSTWDADREQSFRRRATLPVEGPLVSVVMPAWNREHALNAAVESVRNQKYASWQLLIVDDGSSDGTLAAAQELAARDRRILVLSHAHAGVAASRNLALSRAQGEFVAFLDTDNTWRGDFLSAQVAQLTGDPASVASFTGTRMFGGDAPDRFRGGEVTLADLRYGNSIDLNVLVVRSSAISAVGSFDESLKRWVDYDLVLRLAKTGTIKYVPIIGCDYLDEPAPERITSTESPNWQFVVMAKDALDWNDVDSGLTERVPGRVSVVTIAFQDHAMTTRAVDRVLKTTEDLDVEVIILDNGSRADVGWILSQRYAMHPRVRYTRLPRNLNFGTGSNVGFARSTGEYVMFLNNDTEVKDGWLQPLVERLTTTDAFAVQPVMQYPNGNIQTAGTVFNSRNGLATHFLARHPVQDALRHSGDGFSAVTAGAMLIRARDFAAMRGFDPIYANGYEDVDFCLRAKGKFGATFSVEHRSRVVHEESKSPGRFAREAMNQRILRERWAGRMPEAETHHYREVGFTWEHMRASLFPAPMVTRLPRDVDVAGRGSTPSLRWALKIGAQATPQGDRWGDVPYAEDLGRALESIGQEVIIDRVGAHNHQMSYLDDVVLNIRGAVPVEPQAGRVNVLWVISRAERVTVEEVRGYDLVFASSPRWAKWMSEQSGRPVEVLLQATDPSRFNLDVAPSAHVEDLLFVGGPRTLEGGRPVVDAALAAGAQVGLWGPRWEDQASGELVRGEFLDFDEAPAHYRASAIVLNDHMGSMLEWGFINNRTFDAIAAGIPVLSDDIDGLELFDGAAKGAATPEAVADALNDRSWIPSAVRMTEISAMVRQEHSFLRRAEVLLDRVLELAPRLLVRPES